jgi:hypothetical protein
MHAAAAALTLPADFSLGRASFEGRAFEGHIFEGYIGDCGSSGIQADALTTPPPTLLHRCFRWRYL